LTQHEAQAAEAAREVAARLRIEGAIDAGLILGSGMSGVLTGDDDPAVERARIASLPPVVVPGHGDRLRLATIAGKRVLCFEGRNHLYEGVSPTDIALPVAVSKRLGADLLIATTAAGGIQSDLASGDIVVVSDQLNLSGASPLAGSCFVPMDDCYDPSIRRLAGDVLSSLGWPAREGILASVRGPQYETAAEIRFLKGAGADLVSMSLAMETIAARALGLAVLGVAVIVNQAAGIGPGPIDHGDVVKEAGQAVNRLSRFLGRLLERLPTGRPVPKRSKGG